MSSILASLGITNDSQPEDIANSLSNGILSAISDNKPPLVLASLVPLIQQEDITESLDVLNIFSPLLRSTDAAAQEIFLLLGARGNAKELVISIQEAVEHLQAEMVSESNFDDQRSPAAQLNTLIKLYSSALPRMKLRKKTPAETLQPLITELQSALELCCAYATQEEGSTLAYNVFNMILSILTWIDGLDNAAEDATTSCIDILRTLADSIVVDYHPYFRDSVAQRSYRKAFPELVLPSAKKLGSDEEKQIIPVLLKAYSSLGVSFIKLQEKPSIPFLVILAHQLPSPISPTVLLSKLIPLFLTSVQQNVALDESLAILITSLHQLTSSKSVTELSPEIIVPLCTVLPPLAASHPDPPTRYLIFKIISLLLSLSPPHLRLDILRDLTSSDTVPQMRIAAIGLVKEAVFEGISAPPNLFASPQLFQVLGRTLLRPDPPNFFSAIDLSDIQDSPEPSRLVQCLSLYYALLVRDEKNLTGVRDRSMINDVEKSLLSPIRGFTQKWMNESSSDEEILHQNVHVVSLQVALERIDSAVAKFSL